MDAKVLYRMVEEVRQQCRFAQARYQLLRARLHEPDHEKVFLEVHAFLAHAVMVSRMLWPARVSSATRGEALRAALRTPADSPLRMGGSREQIDQFDEAYEDWLLRLPESGYVDMNLMPTGTMLGSREDVFQRSLDPDTLMFHLRGAPMDLRRLHDALRTVEDATQQWLRTHHPW